jgi:hypothetical protein
MKSIYKIIVTSMLVIFIILSGIIFSTNILKSDAIENHIKIAEFHSNVFSEQLTLTFNNIEHIMSDLGLYIENSNDTLLEEKFNYILSRNSYIRSINVLDKNNKIVKSSNTKNIGFEVNNDLYYPTPVFDKHILRFGELQFGRDIAQVDEQLEYIPVSKLITTDKSEYTVVVAISISNFINRYIDSVSANLDHLDIIRVDGKILFSTEKAHKINSHFLPSQS